MLNRVIILNLLILLTASCGGGGGSSADSAADDSWSVDTTFLFDGGPGKDGIPSIDIPSFLPVSSVDYIDDNELVIGIRINDTVKAYPHKILDYHEVLNGKIDQQKFVLSYCPLTGTAMAWDKNSAIGTGEFGVSGLLLNSNLILYDRDTDSHWPQMLMISAQGPKKGTSATHLPVFETKWGTFKTMYPDAQVLDNNTGFARDYQEYPYEFYRTLNNILFRINNQEDFRLHRKDRILGVKVGETKIAYVIEDFDDNIHVLNEQIDESPYAVFASSGKNFAVAFSRTLSDGTVLQFTPEYDQLPIVASDNEGNMWDINGIAISGSRQGQRLSTVFSYNAYWLAWASFYPETTIYNR